MKVEEIRRNAKLEELVKMNRGQTVPTSSLKQEYVIVEKSKYGFYIVEDTLHRQYHIFKGDDTTLHYHDMVTKLSGLYQL
jgi:hypothetical protein